MAIVQPDEIVGLPELFAEVRALRDDVERLKAREPRRAEPPALAVPLALGEPEDDPEPVSMSPEAIRDRVGEVVGERPHDPQPGAPAAPHPEG